MCACGVVWYVCVCVCFDEPVEADGLGIIR